MKYKLIKIPTYLRGKFTFGNIYKVEMYNPLNPNQYRLISDDINKEYVVNIETKLFNEHFLNVKEERREKLIKIENGSK